VINIIVGVWAAVLSIWYAVDFLAVDPAKKIVPSVPEEKKKQ
jgi:hypothetical protein